MPLGTGRASGKIILFGEHAVVYGRPALAAPVTQVWAEAVVEPGAAGSGLVLHAADLGERLSLREAAADDPLATAVRLTLARLSLARLGPAGPDWEVTLRSSIPIASGLGSGAAVSAALVRGLSEAAGRTLPPEDVSALVYEVEKLHHGTPSGIDNTVISQGQPVYFVRGAAPQPFAIGAPFLVVIADSGIASPTKITVGDVRRGWEREPARYEALFDRIGEVVEAARTAIAGGSPVRLGRLMDVNHRLLQELDVSCGQLDDLVRAARDAGALGAKLSGGGRGGNLIAAVTEESAERVAGSLRAAGATSVIVTWIRDTSSATHGEGASF
jgi:mevalonate kinase